jgi:hypothetical protein
VGQPAIFTLVDGSTVDGRLRRGPASIDSRTRTGEALFALPLETRVRAGMFLRGEALLPPRDVIAIPQSSILYDSGQAYVFVVQGVRREGREELVYIARRANIALGGRAGEQVEVVSGLNVNQRIVGAGAAFLQDGDEVRVLADAPRVAPAQQSTQLRGRE